MDNNIVTELNKMFITIKDDVEFLKKVNEMLDSMDKSDAHTVIQKYIEPKSKIMARVSSVLRADKKEYQKYQAIRIEARDSYLHDNKQAKMIDVDRAVSAAYTIVVSMIGQLNRILMRQGEAINKIEERLGIEVTDFIEEVKDDTTKHDDVQGDEDTPNRA